MRQRASITAGFAVALTIALAACSSPLKLPSAPPASGHASTPPATLSTSTMPDVTRMFLDSARRQLRGIGLKDNQIVSTTLGENSLVIKESNWVVLTQTPTAGGTLTTNSIVHLGVVKLTDPKASGITPRA